MPPKKLVGALISCVCIFAPSKKVQAIGDHHFTDFRI